MLFNFDTNQNLLPQDGEVYYHPNLFDNAIANNFLEVLRNNIVWRQDEVVMFGKRIVTKRKVAWYGLEKFNYSYAGTTKSALPFTPALIEIKKAVETKSGATYNSCLLNYYHNGQEGMSWHSDNEPELQPNAAIASVSFGAERNFSFKHKVTKQKVTIPLANGSLLVMQGAIQQHWLHQLPKAAKVNTPRMNLTFRTILNNQI